MIGALLAGIAVAQVRAPLDAGERVAAREMIEDQLDAFERDDAARAWRHVSPGLQRQFGTAERFLETVRTGYAPVHRPREIEFGDVALWDGEPAWWLEVVGPDGRRWRALYLLEVQPDGTWRTSGCLLFGVDVPRPGGV